MSNFSKVPKSATANAILLDKIPRRDLLILKLCEIFGVSADYLLGRAELPSPELSEEETELVLAFRRADDRSREMVRLALAPFTATDITAESAK